jgi:hypothetical protein
MNAREIILQDCVNLNKGEQSILEKRQEMANVFHLSRKIEKFSFFVVFPATLFFSITKRHTGRSVYRNLFLFNTVLFLFVNANTFALSQRLMKEYDCKSEDLNSRVSFYRNALLDRN